MLRTNRHTAMCYIVWNNGSPQTAMGYWLKSFNNKTNPPLPGTTFTVAEINNRECAFTNLASLNIE